ncbi:IPT/TIG domain-containing protein [Caloranaerobacter ferrireducens]|uniref:IPT/TIG domain-containing protein n=1 Tax=Caloranaerobacter ferrireducens TaxID=1323370 RepID=UPI00084D6F79|nr:IPT/TIG domain-containing protein [Caloranaerobacter ferrireducens]
MDRLKRFFSIILAVILTITYIPYLDMISYSADTLSIDSITPNKVSAANGKIITIMGTGFGNDKTEIAEIKIIYDGEPTIVNLNSDDILSINDTEVSIRIPQSTNGYIGLAYLSISRTGWGSDSIPFEYINDPIINKIVTNTEISIERDADGNIVKNPDGSAKRTKETYLEIYGFNFNLPGDSDNIEDYIELKNAESTMAAEVIYQSEGYIKAKLPENFIYGDSYEITVKNKFGGSANSNQTITLAEHDITQLSNLKVNIGGTLIIYGTNFPSETDLKVYIGEENGEKEAVVDTSTLTSTQINITVPQVATTNYQNVKVLDNSKQTAVTLVDELEVLPSPTPFTVSAITPNAGTKQGGTEVRIVGTNLTPDMKIMFGENYATNVEFDTEMSVDGTTVLKAITPPSDTIGAVDVKIINPIDNGEFILEKGYRYTEVENSLVVIDINPTEGYETGGDLVSITGLNFQRTKEDDNGDIVSDEKEFTLSEDNKILTLESDVIKDYPKLGTSELVDVVRVRTVKVYFGGELAEIQTIQENGQDVPTIINKDTGQQVLRVKSPQVALKPRVDTSVDLSVEITTKFIDASTYNDGDDSNDIVIDQFTEKEVALRQFIYKPVPSAPELNYVYLYKVNGLPLIDENSQMAKGPSESKVYIYGLDFRPDAKVYFFKEDGRPLNELLVSSNEGQVVSVDTLQGALNGKTINRIEVIVPNIKELGPVTVLVENADGGRTKTIAEFVEEGSYTDKELEVRQFEYISTPIINEVSPEFGSTNYTEDGQTVIRNPLVVINGDMFLAIAETDQNGETTIKKPYVYVVPESITTQEIENDHYNNPDAILKYRGEVLEVTTENDNKLIKLDGVKDKLGNRMVVKMPSVNEENGGYRDIIVINPDGGINRLEDAFEYRKPESRPEIISIKPDKGNVLGGERVVITGKDFDYDPQEVLIIVTIDGEKAQIEKIERSISGADNTVDVTIITPRGTEGKKIVQVINQDGGTAEGYYTYTRVYTNPVIKTIAPSHGGPLTEVIIKGDDFVLPNPDSQDEDEQHGTRVFFNDYEIQTSVTDENQAVIEDVYVIDKETIRIVVPDDLPLGLKDVTIVNPDTAKFTIEDGFNYLKPQSNPTITSISPSEGSRDGGTIVTIEGTDFMEDIEVYFGEKKGINPIVNGDGTKIFVTTPDYEVDEKITDRVSVPVTIVNFDGGSDTVRDGFTFRVPGSFPTIEKIDPSVGSTAGYDTITIIGTDFRYSDLNSNGKWDEGEPLPKVYFNGIEALDVQYSSYKVLIVKTPPYLEPGKVDVILVNPDAGTFVFKDGFTYEKSKPEITSVTPDTVTKLGGTELTILGKNFIDRNKINPENYFGGEDIDLEVIFGDEYDYTPIVGGHGIVEVGNLQVEYDNRDVEAENNVFVRLDGEDKISFNIKEGQTRIETLPTGLDETKLEGIKIELKDNKLMVTRRLSPRVEYIDENTLVVVTPPQDTIGEKKVKVVNIDGGTGEGVIEIKNPNSQPVITDIEPKRPIYKADSEEVDYYVVESTIDGGLTFTIEGSDFRKGVRVMIGSEEAEIISRSNEDDKIVVRSPEGREIDINKPLRIVVINEDGGTADSSLKEGLPIYYVYRIKESNPVIEEVTPDRGSAAGGDRITITGNDFRIENITVRIGAKEATVVLEESSYKKLVVITPSSDILGPVDVFVRNESALGEVVLKNGFTYYSNPTITDITPDEVHFTGGQKVTIKGTLFMEGIKVYIDGEEVKDVAYIDENTIEIITPEGDLGDKDVKIENTDGGSFVAIKGLKYILPIPANPTGFFAYPGHERSIVLKWSETDGAERYKIFGKKKGEEEYKFIAETLETEYYIKDLDEDTKYYFKLWAVNKYGESKGYAYAYTTTLDSKEDKGDSKYKDESVTVESIIKNSAGSISVLLPEIYTSSQYTVKLTDKNYKDFKQIELTIPLRVVMDNYGRLIVNSSEVYLDLPFYSLKTGLINKIQNIDNDSNVKVIVARIPKAEKHRISKKLRRREKLLTDGFKIQFMLQEGKSIIPFEMYNYVTVSLIVNKENLDKERMYLGILNVEKNRLDKYEASIYQVFDYSLMKWVYYVEGRINKEGKFVVGYR